MRRGTGGPTYFDPRAGRISVQQYALDRWLPSQVHLRPNSRALYESHLRTHILPLLGDRQIGAPRRPDRKSFVAALNAKLAPATVVTVYAMLAAAVDDR